MFTGIVKNHYEVVRVERLCARSEGHLDPAVTPRDDNDQSTSFPAHSGNPCPQIGNSNFIHYEVLLDEALVEGLEIGASVSVSGVCQTVVSIDGVRVAFDAMKETLDRTTISEFKEGQRVNIERSVRFGDEIGGHLCSGHVMGTATIQSIVRDEANCNVRFSCPGDWMKYLLPKGFITLDGASLTLVDVDPKGSFSVCLIPETLRLTTFGLKKEGDKVNVEIDPMTQAIVATVERCLLNNVKTN